MADSIDDVWVFISTDETGEGVCAFHGPMGWMPMVAADQARIDTLRPMAEQMAKGSGRRIVLSKFSKREDIEVFEP